MEKLLQYISEQNKYFNPKDSLSKLIDQTLSSGGEELEEEDLLCVQAARGVVTHKPADQRKETD